MDCTILSKPIKNIFNINHPDHQMSGLTAYLISDLMLKNFIEPLKNEFNHQEQITLPNIEMYLNNAFPPPLADRCMVAARQIRTTYEISLFKVNTLFGRDKLTNAAMDAMRSILEFLILQVCNVAVEHMEQGAKRIYNGAVFDGIRNNLELSHIFWRF